MRTSTITSLVALAASASAQYLNQTGPFALVVFSSNDTINGTTLTTCHEGAAIEGLCIGATYSSPPSDHVTTFYQNYSASNPQPAAVGQVGYLTYELVGGNFVESEPLQLSYNPASNVAVPLFTPAESGLQISFLDNQFGVYSTLNDEVAPPTFQETVYFDRWFICETNVGYQYTTLAFVLGKDTPQNPSCVAATIKRVFAP